MTSVVTFYSFKGGVGRSMALANVAVLLARRGLRVLAVDWDLEAPGLEKYFDYFEHSATSGGLLPFLIEQQERLVAGQAGTPESYRGHLWEVDVGAAQPLRLLCSGRVAHLDYAKKLEQLDWQEFFARGGGEVLERLRDLWRDEFDVVLIDSRTGMSDAGGICTIQMPDVLVPMFTANHQSLNGIRDIVQSAQAGRQRLAYDRMPLTVLPIPSRFSTQADVKMSQEWLTRFAEVLEGCCSDWLPKWVTPKALFERLKLPQSEAFAFGERLAVVDQGISDPTGLGYTYDRITDLLASDFRDLEAALGSIARAPSQTTELTRPLPKASGDSIHRTPTPRNKDYDYDVFVSYSADAGVLREWIPTFIRLVSDWLTLELPRPVTFFDVQSLELGDSSLPEAISRALGRSRVLLALLTPAYFGSEWCIREWATFAGRERATRSTLIVPVALRGMESFPDVVRARQVLQGSEALSDLFARRATTTVEYAALVKSTVAALHRMITAAPAYDESREDAALEGLDELRLRSAPVSQVRLSLGRKP